jgi:hypothetical protein
MRFHFASLLTLIITSVTTGQPPPTDSSPPMPPTFQAPKGWKSMEAGPSVFARFQIGEKDAIATVVVVELPGNGGGLVPNVNRWRAQLKLEPLPEKDALQSLKAIKVNGIDGHLLDITGRESTDKSGQRIVAVVLPREKQTWFFGIAGPRRLVGDQKEAFEAFVNSFRFEK